MIHVIAASCDTGSWQQKWSCGWHQPPSQAAVSAGYFAGHNLAPIVIGLFILWLVVKAALRAASGKAARGRG